MKEQEVQYGTGECNRCVEQMLTFSNGSANADKILLVDNFLRSGDGSAIGCLELCVGHRGETEMRERRWG